MTQRIIDWPAAIKLGSQDFGLIQPLVSSTSAFSGATFDKLMGPPRWAMSFDLPDQPAKMLPEIEATIRQMRNGLNLLRFGDKRRGGNLHASPGGERWAQQLIPWSALMRDWARSGVPATPISQGVSAMGSSSFVKFAAEVVRAGIEYVAAVRVEASDADAMVSLSLNGGPMMGCIFLPRTRFVAHTWGDCIAASYADGAGWIVCLRFTPKKDFQPQVQVHAIHSADMAYPVALSRPVLAMTALGMPPSFVESRAAPVYTSVRVQVRGSGQTGDMLNTRGWIPDSKIRAGAWLNYGDGMHKVLRDAVADGAGRASLWIEPPIRKTPADGADVVVQSVTGLFKLKTQPRIRQEGMVVKGVTLEFEEYPQ